jgi:hypothetical protein
VKDESNGPSIGAVGGRRRQSQGITIWIGGDQWDLVGRRSVRVVFGKGSGRASTDVGLERRGVRATEGQEAEIMLRIEERSIAQQGLLTEAECAQRVQATVAS